jgi:hypothetical protein
MPVAPIARQTRRLDRKDGADAPLADRGQQALEAGSGDTAAGAAKIIVDDLDLGPAELPGAIGKPVLPLPALVIVGQLIGRRLPDIYAQRARCSDVILLIAAPSVCQLRRDLAQ